MNIPVEQLLHKMTDELQKANQSIKNEQLREHLIVIRSLCDVILEQKPKEMGNSVQTEQQSTQPQSVAPKRIEDDEDANSDSIFDF